MTRRGLAAVAALGTSLLCALSLGNSLYLFIGLTLAAAMVYGFLSCFWARRTAFCRPAFSAASVVRGDEAWLTLTAGHRCPLPVAPPRAVFFFNGQAGDCLFPAAPFYAHERRLPLNARHVGRYPAGLKALELQDVFGLFRMRLKPESRGVLTVLPRPFEIDKPRLTLGDDGSAALARTQEDYSAPEDVRAYQPGDAMKRVHWKLSSRKRELLVRRYETPAPPDTLILLDCNAPTGGENVVEGKQCLWDALCETAAAVSRLQMADGSPVRLPLYGEKAGEFASRSAASLAMLQDMLACQPCGGGEDFARVLDLELRRMRRTGATVVITTRLDAQIVEAISHIRRMGPSARLYLVTYAPDAPEYQPYVTRLQHHLVEVCYVTPA